MSFESRIALFCTFYPEAPQELIVVSRALVRAAQQVQQEIDRVLASCGINYSQYLAMAMLFIEQGKEVNPSELARILDMTPTQVTRLIDGLVSEDWVDRKSDIYDRRRLLLTLTAVGHDQLQRAMPLVHQAYRQVWKSYSAAEIGFFNNMLERMCVLNYDKMDQAK